MEERESATERAKPGHVARDFEQQKRPNIRGEIRVSAKGIMWQRS